MSRNMRQKYPPTPVKIKVKSRTANRRDSSSSDSSLNLSDDDGYSAVEEVSDSEDNDEEDVDAAEEEHIITHTLHRKGAVGTPRPGPNEQGEDLEGVADEEEADGEDDEEADDDENEEEADDDLDDTSSWNGVLSEIDENATSDSHHFNLAQDMMGVERHVRFTGVPDSDSDSTATDTTNGVEEYFPDIFVSQTSLDPAFRREIERDPDESSDSTSFWDFHGNYDLGPFPDESDLDLRIQTVSEDNTPVGTPMASQVPTEASTPVAAVDVYQELDGYETDGDTTEDDIPEPIVRKKQHHRVQTGTESDSETNRRVRFRRGKPRVGRFNLDSSEKKPIAVMNPISRKMMIFTPQRLRRLDLSPESFNIHYFNNPSVIQSSPIMSNSGTMMMGAMFSSNTFGDFMNTQAVGPVEAFFSVSSDAAAGEDSDEFDGMVEDSDAEERNLKLEDFITFNGHDSDEEGAGLLAQDLQSDADDETCTVASTPGQGLADPFGRDENCPSTQLHPLLSHFGNNSDAVGAFRRNQVNQQLIASDKASRESLAFSGPYHHGTLRGIKDGSLHTVSTPITPMRRQKRRGASVSFSGPTAAMGNGTADVILNSPSEKASQKRKASSSVDPTSGLNHKKQRSISDVQSLHL